MNCKHFCVKVNYFWALRQAVRETFLCAGLSHARVPMTIFSAFNDNICHSIFNCRRLTLKEVDFTNNLRRIKFQKLILIYSQFYKHFRILIDKVNIFSVNFIIVLHAAFTLVDPKSTKKTVKLSVFFTLDARWLL